jgi:hypothetical protein
MAICKLCGKKYSVWSAQGPGSGVCNECWPEYSKIEAEEKQREARATLPVLFAQHVPGKNARILGAAYWDTLGSAVGTGVAKLVSGGVFGILGGLLTGTRHHAGIVALTNSNLFLVDLGIVVGEDLTLKELRGAVGPPSVKKAPLRNLTAECDPQAGVLILKGNLRVKATFPRSFEEGNPSKAALIASTINSHS